MVKAPVKIKSKSKAKRKSRKKSFWNRKIWFMKGKWWVTNGTVLIIVLLVALVFVGAVISLSKKSEMKDDYNQLETVYEKLYDIDYASTKKEAGKINGKVENAEESLKLCQSREVFYDTYHELDELIEYLESHSFGKKYVRYFRLLDEDNSLTEKYNKILEKYNATGPYVTSQGKVYNQQMEDLSKQFNQKASEIKKIENEIEKMQNQVIKSLEDASSSLYSLENELDGMNLWDFLWVSY